MRSALAVLFALAAGAPRAHAAPTAGTETFALRGVAQTLHLYGAPGRPVAIVSSGDGGWVHLAPEVSEMLALAGYRVIGLDSKAYLASFTSRGGPLAADDVPRDFLALVDRASREGPGRPVLIGISEGAGLSVLAACAPALRGRVAGVVALGLPDRNELGWRWRDSLIYVTKKTPDEPTFSVRERIASLAPVPLAAIHSRRDEFVPVAEVQDILDRAREPKRLWLLDAQDHRFSGAREALERALAEALAWIVSA